MLLVYLLTLNTENTDLRKKILNDTTNFDYRVFFLENINE